ncbi:expressed unknown protein [Seminavis robusta]|uniref:Uncharacterized protein n=1 Tax=Seminavis robusta TaxID=568900 RepID=A0A9N8E6P4_9STRA|nr:expressed unknown protein [Seminavis robusta]|eukprot:Sro679_g186090.1 n/a (647) ;mRNA; r:29443-31383
MSDQQKARRKLGKVFHILAKPTTRRDTTLHNIETAVGILQQNPGLHSLPFTIKGSNLGRNPSLPLFHVAAFGASDNQLVRIPGLSLGLGSKEHHTMPPPQVILRLLKAYQNDDDCLKQQDWNLILTTLMDKCPGLNSEVGVLLIRTIAEAETSVINHGSFRKALALNLDQSILDVFIQNLQSPIKTLTVEFNSNVYSDKSPYTSRRPFQLTGNQVKGAAAVLPTLESFSCLCPMTDTAEITCYPEIEREADRTCYYRPQVFLDLVRSVATLGVNLKRVSLTIPAICIEKKSLSAFGGWFELLTGKRCRPLEDLTINFQRGPRSMLGSDGLVEFEMMCFVRSLARRRDPLQRIVLDGRFQGNRILSSRFILELLKLPNNAAKTVIIQNFTDRSNCYDVIEEVGAEEWASSGVENLKSAAPVPLSVSRLFLTPKSHAANLQSLTLQFQFRYSRIFIGDDEPEDVTDDVVRLLSEPRRLQHLSLSGDCQAIRIDPICKQLENNESLQTLDVVFGDCCVCILNLLRSGRNTRLTSFAKETRSHRTVQRKLLHEIDCWTHLNLFGRGKASSSKASFVRFLISLTRQEDVPSTFHYAMLRENPALWTNANEAELPKTTLPSSNPNSQCAKRLAAVNGGKLAVQGPTAKKPKL